MPSHRILLIEDNIDSCASLSELLGLLGHQVETAYDGLEGIARGIAYRPDLAIIDIGLPGADGFEVARQLRRALDPTAKLVAYTAYDRRVIENQATLAGFDAVYTKPNDLGLLMAAVGVG